MGLRNEKNKLFCIKYKIADILINDGIWEGRILNPNKMEKAINLLNINLNELEEELEQEKKQFKNWINYELLSNFSNSG